jgi:hypothetical protein
MITKESAAMPSDGAALKLVENPDLLPCFLCGQGTVSRAKLLRDLGVKEMADILNVGVDDVMRKFDSQGLKFFKEVEKRLEETYRDREENHKSEVAKIQREAGSLSAQLKQTQDQLVALQGKQKGNPADIGKTGEVEFKAWADAQPRIECSDKLEQQGDYLLRVREEVNAALVPIPVQILIDNKKNKALTDADIVQLVGDARTRKLKFAMIVCSEDDQLRKKDRERRVREQDGVLVVISWIAAVVSDLDLLSPLLRISAERKEERVDYRARLEAMIRRISEKLASLDKIAACTREIRKQADAADEVLRTAKADLIRACSVVE